MFIMLINESIIIMCIEYRLFRVDKGQTSSAYRNLRLESSIYHICHALGWVGVGVEVGAVWGSFTEYYENSDIDMTGGGGVLKIGQISKNKIVPENMYKISSGTEIQLRKNSK